MDKAYYNKYYLFERKHWWFTVREKIIGQAIVTWVGPSASERILNTGVATARSTQFLDQFGAVTSVENDKECCRFVREELNLPVIEASVTELPFPHESFDLVTAFDVIEHVKQDEKAITEFNRVLKPAASLVITVPAYPFLWSEHDEVNHHYRRYTASAVRELLSRNGFDIVYLTYFNSLLLLPIAAYRILSRSLRSKRHNRYSDFEMPAGIIGWLNIIFKNIFLFESRLLKKFRMPAGVSILVVAKKRVVVSTE